MLDSFKKESIYLTCELLSYQLGDELMKMNFSDEQFQEFSYMAEFVALFYCPWFFKSSLSADSPLNDLDIVEDIRKLRDACSDDPKVVIAAEQCLKSIYRHSRYLHPQLVVMALGSDKVMAIERKAIAEAMMVMKPQFDVKKVTLEYVYLLFK